MIHEEPTTASPRAASSVAAVRNSIWLRAPVPIASDAPIVKADTSLVSPATIATASGTIIARPTP